jgi:C4-dicarboxylate-specific signal transduction histidine kinase
MALDKPYRRLPLRDLMTDAEKRSRDVAEHMHSTWGGSAADLRDLSRPLRRKSHYPTLVALQNSLQKLIAMTEQTGDLIDYLERQLNEIRDHAKRERLNRH